MAKLLGQDIVTHEEFNQFVESDFKKHEIEMRILSTQILALSAIKTSLENRIKHLAVIASVSVLVSLATAVFVVCTK